MDCLVETYVPPLVSDLPTKYIDLNQISRPSYFHVLYSSQKSFLKQATDLSISFFFIL